MKQWPPPSQAGRRKNPGEWRRLKPNGRTGDGSTVGAGGALREAGGHTRHRTKRERNKKIGGRRLHHQSGAPVEDAAGNLGRSRGRPGPCPRDPGRMAAAPECGDGDFPAVPRFAAHSRTNNPRDKPAGRNLGRDLALVVVVAVAVAFFFPGFELGSAWKHAIGRRHTHRPDPSRAKRRPISPAHARRRPLWPNRCSRSRRFCAPSMSARSLPQRRRLSPLCLAAYRSPCWTRKAIGPTSSCLPRTGGVSDGWIFSTYLGAPGGQKP